MRLLALLAWALLPGCGAVTGPGEVRGFLGDVLSVTCTYEPGQEERPKFWCKLRTILLFDFCDGDIIMTSEWKPKAQKGRFSIRDNHTLRAFTVTVDNLSKEDEGTFLCGVKNTYLDDKHAVKVIVDTASSTLPSSACTTTTFSDLTLSVTGHTQTVSQGEIEQSTSNPSTPQVLNLVEHILTPAVIVVLFLLVVAAGILVILSRKKKALSSADIEMDRTRSMSPTQDAGALNYADINHGTGGAESPYINAGAVRPLETPPMEYVEVRQSAQPLEDEGEALYAKAQKLVPRQEQIYANVPAAPRPSEELYSTVWER